MRRPPFCLYPDCYRERGHGGQHQGLRGEPVATSPELDAVAERLAATEHFHDHHGAITTERQQLACFDPRHQR